jgi:predicted PurR-regulated permease PerM
MSESAKKEVLWGKLVLRWMLILIAGFIVGWVLYCSVSTLVLLAFSFLLAYLLNPVVTKLTKKGAPRTAAIVLLMFCFVVVIVGFTLYIVPKISNEATRLINHNEAFTSASVWISENVNPKLAKIGIDGWKEEVVREKINNLFSLINSYYPQWIRPTFNAFHSMFSGIASFIVGLLSLMLVPVFTFHLLRDFPKISQSFFNNIPPHWRAIASDWGGELDQVVGGYIRGQFSIALVLAAINAIGLTILGVPFGFLIGFVAGMANMVPYMSIVVGLIPALIISFLDKPEIWRLIWILMIFGGSQMLEGFYLSPRIMGHEIGLHPVLIMLSIILGGSIFGLVGIILAVPSMAVLKVVAVRAHHSWKNKWPQEA